MAIRPGPRAVRAVISGFAAVIALAPSSTVGDAATSPLQIAINARYHGAVKLGTWVPVTVDVTNRGQQFDGTLEIGATTSSLGQAGPPAGVAVYQSRLSLAPGAPKHISTYLSQDYAGTPGGYAGTPTP